MIEPGVVTGLEVGVVTGGLVTSGVVVVVTTVGGVDVEVVSSVVPVPIPEGDVVLELVDVGVKLDSVLVVEDSVVSVVDTSVLLKTLDDELVVVDSVGLSVTTSGSASRTML